MAKVLSNLKKGWVIHHQTYKVNSSYFFYPARNMGLKRRHKKILTVSTINQSLVTMDFAVKGEVLLKANELAEELKKVN